MTSVLVNMLHFIHAHPYILFIVLIALFLMTEIIDIIVRVGYEEMEKRENER